MPGGQRYLEQVLIRRGLGRSLNKQKTRSSAGAEVRVFRIWRAIGIACDFCRSKACGHICIACYYYTKFGLNWLSRLLCYTDFSKKPHCTNNFGQKSRYNILPFQGKGTRGFAKVVITKCIS